MKKFIVKAARGGRIMNNSNLRREEFVEGYKFFEKLTLERFGWKSGVGGGKKKSRGSSDKF